LSFFSFSSGAACESAENQGPRKFAHSKCKALAGAWCKERANNTFTVKLE